MEEAYIMAILSKAGAYMKGVGPLQAHIGEAKRSVDLTES